jgi:hypothetical protein
LKGTADGLRTHMEGLPHDNAATSPVVPAKAGIQEGLNPSYVRILMTTYMPVAAWSAVAPKGLTLMVNCWFAAALFGTWRL